MTKSGLQSDKSNGLVLTSEAASTRHAHVQFVFAAATFKKNIYIAKIKILNGQLSKMSDYMKDTFEIPPKQFKKIIIRK